uniref:Uncharacterized protein n=1 Tax=Myotis myotis TaxID=51298 RepID=A0A7J7SC83_MYOMY|nr:hypothetical protein mMyoMyo1_009529 [Myotis myotis]
MTESAAAGSAGAGRGGGGGTETSPAPGASASSVSPAENGRCRGVLPGCGAAARSLQSRGAARDPASLQPAPRLRAGAATCGKAWRGGFGAAGSRSAAAPRGRPPSLGGEGCGQPARGHPGAPFPRRRAHASSSAAGAPQPRAAPAVKARGRRCARPGPEAAEFARRSRGTRPAGQPGGTQPARSSPGSTLTAVGKIPSRHIRRRPLGCASRGRRRGSARRLGWAPASSIGAEGARKVSKPSWARHCYFREEELRRARRYLPPAPGSHYVTVLCSDSVC